MQKVRKILIFVMLCSIFIYPLKKHSDIVFALSDSVFRIVKEPLTLVNHVFESRVTSGFPADCMEIITSFKEKLPDQAEYFQSEVLASDALLSQRTIEYSFPKLKNKNAKCGYVPSAEVIDLKKYTEIDKIGAIKIVCLI